MGGSGRVGTLHQHLALHALCVLKINHLLKGRRDEQVNRSRIEGSLINRLGIRKTFDSPGRLHVCRQCFGIDAARIKNGTGVIQHGFECRATLLEQACRPGTHVTITYQTTRYLTQINAHTGE